jgi:hypothetical protein
MKQSARDSGVNRSFTLVRRGSLQLRMGGCGPIGGGLTAAEIAARVEALAAQIARTIPADFVMVGLLKGATMFVADLARELDRAGARREIADPSRLSGA